MRYPKCIEERKTIIMLAQMSKDISIYGQDYTKLKELGRGKFGVVFRVKSQQTGQDFAAKYVK